MTTLTFWQASFGAPYKTTVACLRRFLVRCRNGDLSPTAFNFLTRPNHLGFIESDERPSNEGSVFVLKLIEKSLIDAQMRETLLGAFCLRDMGNNTLISLVCPVGQFALVQKSTVKLADHFAREAGGRGVEVTYHPLPTDSRREYVVAGRIRNIQAALSAFNAEYAAFGYWIEAPREPCEESRTWFLVLKTDGSDLQSYLQRWGRWEVSIWECLEIGEKTRMVIGAPSLDERDNYWAYVTNLMSFLRRFGIGSDVVPHAESSEFEISIDEIESFREVRSVTPQSVRSRIPLDLSEDEIQTHIEEIIGEPFHKKDWGGEQNDLFTSRLVIRERRVTAAFMLKGNGTKGKLTIKRCGRNGDQIERLTGTSVDLYVVQHVNEIDESVRSYVRTKVESLNLRGRKCQMCVIDGGDLARLLVAYKKLPDLRSDSEPES